MSGLDAVKAATWSWHAHAERSGIIADILARQATRFGVALLLRNLLPVYQALDATRFGLPPLVRSAAIQEDLLVLGSDADLPLLAEATAYADLVHAAAEGDGTRLIAHAYTRYLGDLNGGLIMKRRLIGSLGETARRLTFHDYPLVKDIATFTRAYRADLDLAVRKTVFELVAAEAVMAFRLNIALSEAVRTKAAAV